MSTQSICPICLDKINIEYMTNCGHVFCTDCIHGYYDFHKDIKCPMCRAEINIEKDPYYGRKIPFDNNNYPENPDIKENEVLVGYKTVSRLNKWKLLYDYQVDNNRGFMFAQEKEIKQLMNDIDMDFRGHSGFSLAYTMRHLQFISYYGLTRYHNIMAIK
jgi:hypothetical protein